MTCHLSVQHPSSWNSQSLSDLMMPCALHPVLNRLYHRGPRSTLPISSASSVIHYTSERQVHLGLSFSLPPFYLPFRPCPAHYSPTQDIHQMSASPWPSAELRRSLTRGVRTSKCQRSTEAATKSAFWGASSPWRNLAKTQVFLALRSCVRLDIWSRDLSTQSPVPCRRVGR